MRTAPIVLLLLLVLAAPVAVAAPLISLSISAGELERGQAYTVTLGITDVAGWLDVVLTTPPGITIEDVETTGDPWLRAHRHARACGACGACGCAWASWAAGRAGRGRADG